MAGSKSDFRENQVLDALYGSGNPATLYVALHTARPSDAGAGGTEVSTVGTGYARAAVTNNAANWPAAAAGVKSNGAVITLPTPTGAWGTIVAWSVWDALSGGNMLDWGDLVGTEAVALAGTDDVFNATAHGLTDGMRVLVTQINGVVLPGGVASGYFFVRDSAANTFKLATVAGGAAVDVTSIGAARVGEDRSRDVRTGETVDFQIGALVITED